MMWFTAKSFFPNPTKKHLNFTEGKNKCVAICWKFMEEPSGFMDALWRAFHQTLELLPFSFSESSSRRQQVQMLAGIQVTFNKGEKMKGGFGHCHSERLLAGCGLMSRLSLNISHQIAGACIASIKARLTKKWDFTLGCRGCFPLANVWLEYFTWQLNF